MNFKELGVRHFVAGIAVGAVVVGAGVWAYRFFRQEQQPAVEEDVPAGGEPGAAEFDEEYLARHPLAGQYMPTIGRLSD